ncbi:MAG: PHP domain-containing protein [Candidatus Hydrogenedentes bacterium]|nr:PHP domain-containing protein [Candidatus Hydrogenedentota bacterium]
MGLLIDVHVHTKRYSACSQLDPGRLIERAVKAGLNGVVITEHARQWEPAELEALVAQSGHPGFLLLAGFEYTTTQGDLLIYGLRADEAHAFEPGWTPAQAADRVSTLGGVCIAAHPTRAGVGFDEQLLTLPLSGIEVASVRMQPHEQQLAMRIAQTAQIAPIAASDAHRLQEVGRFATEFEDPIGRAHELREALRRGRFRVAGVGARRKSNQ